MIIGANIAPLIVVATIIAVSPFESKHKILAVLAAGQHVRVTKPTVYISGKFKNLHVINVIIGMSVYLKDNIVVIIFLFTHTVLKLVKFKVRPTQKAININRG